ncbi:MAG TPA: hypothetical protein VN706_05655 [Gemmatimonadaceae bacterium]|nr:hypothetical protein [Gemmatimonadaceae bacterium]
MSYAGALELLENALAGERRRAILDTLEASGDFTRALARLRVAMRTNTFPSANGPLALERFVRTFDTRTRSEGFHVLESWDYRAHRFSENTVPVLMLDRCVPDAVPPDRRRAALALLLDQYFLALVGLLAVRAWDDGDPNANFDRVTSLVAALNGSNGSGQRFVEDAETVLLVAISHYHPHEPAYDTLIDRVWTLDEDHRLRLATACSATLGSHLRWGHRFMYQRDISRMRADNVVDYPWLLFSLVTLARAVGRASPGSMERKRISEALLNGLSADPWAFTGKVPRSLERFSAEHATLRTMLQDGRAMWHEAFSVHQPRPGTFTPLGLLCNFLCNAIVAMVDTGLAGAVDHPSLNELFESHPGDADAPSAAESYSKTLMAYASANGGRSDGAALIVYDPYEAQTAFNATMRVLSA